MSEYFGHPERVEIWPAQTHLQPIDCVEIAWIRMLGACDLLSAQRAKKNASAIVYYKVDQAARKRGQAQAGMAVANYTAQLRSA